jgi:hypothetical protein
MIIQIDRELKIKLLQALKSGFIDTLNFPELANPDNRMPDDFLDTLTSEEKEVLLKIGEKALNYTCK